MVQKISRQSLWLCLLLFLFPILPGAESMAAPLPDLWPRWQANVPDSPQKVDHRLWDGLLKKYVVVNHPSGINRVRYADFTPDDRRSLDEYIIQLQQVKVTGLRRAVQKAYWINLYNGVTVQVILDHYPVKSIRDIDISPGFFSSGPWDAELVHIEGQAVTLNDIEHRILRPIFKDNRLHYALNCASLGCPDLQPTAFTGENSEELLEAAARSFINSGRGGRISGSTITVSSIYKWFRVDFGDSQHGVIQHVLQYRRGDLVSLLQRYDKSLRYEYDWGLNAP